MRMNDIVPQLESAESAKIPRKVSVVVQTHWDREWYFPHQTFIARLMDVMSRVVAQLDSGRLKFFLFDGQTAAFEDLLLNAEPKLVADVRRLVRDKRIILGPWYVMADEFLCSGESLIRNLEIGIADATAAGNCQLVGYLPDTFGHVGQMPQILRTMGIHSAVLWRGADAPQAEFDWQAPDGSVVGTVFLTQGYYQHPLNVEDANAALARYLADIAPYSLADELLLTQGGDHLMTVDNLQPRLRAFNESQTKYRLEENTLAAHVQSVLAETDGKRVTILGDLRSNERAFVLPDVLSTRRYLKRLNQAAEDRLLGEIEPLLAQLNLGEQYPRRYLDQSWRMAIQQQAHDSICGCSVDSVHREMLTRYAQLEQRFDALIERASAAAGMVSTTMHAEQVIDVFADDEVFTLFNPLPHAFVGKQVIKLFLRGEKKHGVTITSSTGAPLSTTLISVVEHAIFRSPIDEFPDRVSGHLYEVAVDCPKGALAGLGHIECKVLLSDTSATQSTLRTVATTSPQIENQVYRITLEANGELSLYDKRRNRTTAGFIGLHAELDCGDSYNFSPPPHQEQIIQRKFLLERMAIEHGFAKLILSIEIEVPQELNATRTGRHQGSVTNCGVLRLRLCDADSHLGSNGIDARLIWNNQAKDQRTRLIFRINSPVAETWSDSAFAWTKRPVTYANYPSTPSRREMPVVVQPSLSAILAGDFFVCHRAMQEYEMLQIDGEQHLGMTLIRSVSWMSRRDLVTRGVGAGPDMETPDAQCLGQEIFEFQMGHLFEEEGVDVLTYAQRFRRPLKMLRGHTSMWREGLDIGNTTLQTSSVRRLGAQIEIRLWNPSSQPQSLALSNGFGGWTRVNADGSALDLAQTGVESLVVAPYVIATFRKPLQAT
jgi:mannosylglycerate hydrolase